ncbi:hypothetical protein JKP88DRAFT_288965 [Tribonema minus]|uniref:Uncharacterized protein n=1 Tax=Tribonema minus TaxID=303371 RepID=A0A836CHL4_9STRA|nr:hypothetical protein JKP88DRAFT_288965 [Tribonema minus]
MPAEEVAIQHLEEQIAGLVAESAAQGATLKKLQEDTQATGKKQALYDCLKEYNTLGTVGSAPHGVLWPCHDTHGRIQGGGHMEEDVGEDPEMPFGGGGV